MKKTKLSLIIPVYNKAPFLERCFESVEPVEGLEVIVIDDGSDDGSLKICKEYCKKNKWQLYENSHKGVSYARNFGMSHAKGDYIAFLDADDEYVDGATEHLVKMAQNEMSHNIIEFGRYICKDFPIRILRTARRGWYELQNVPEKSWVLVWNKLYRKEFLETNKITFREDLTFGEDELFNVEALAKNNGMWIVNRALINHHLDDMNSICRGGLCKEWIQTLDYELRKRMKNAENETVRDWLMNVIDKHEKSKTFKQYNFQPKIPERKGKYDVVYLLKDTQTNYELRYSLRSVVENFPHRKIVFAGGKPCGLEPDIYLKVEQDRPSKWENTRKNLEAVVNDDRITDNFWLFNDDFFVLEPANEKTISYYDNNIDDAIKKTERGFGHSIDWTRRLRKLISELTKRGLPTLNYAVHKPMLINRKKLKKVLDEFPDEPMIRALYGNYYKIKGENSPDYKVRVTKYQLSKVEKWNFVSTQDDSFRDGNIGQYLRNKFYAPTRFEIDEMVTIKPTQRYYDAEKKRTLDQFSAPFETTIERAEVLADRGLVKIMV